MTSAPPDTRVDPPDVGDEVAQVNGFLDYLRGTVVRKAHGLSEVDARRAVLPSPLMTVAGLLGHLRWVEAHWFGVVLDGQHDRAPWDPADPDAEFRVPDGVPLARLVEEYEAECAHSRGVAAGMAFDDTGTFEGRTVSLRWVLLHMVEETGRHAGHLDAIRELLDGATGE
ncbi:DinB family protein [Actinokineospora bangkokensis]|uniref:Mini-circle protein n=1 Tax=Actinokineospora bangkokensis TaxID=1193682 RepID=A0A1Q9LQ76_9PSEU|nr:DinB family protein [Actinokineospora bangkokensis]OLR94196.1 mini-circle protein [Actinokineospora bangkokensis]